MESWQVLQWGRPLQKVLGPRPEPKGTEVLVRVSACGVCHSDLHIRDGAYDLGAGRSIELGRIGIHLPLTMGHEILGTVVAAGPDAPPVEPGTEGVVFPWIGCGACRHCRAGAEIDCETPISLGTRRPGGYGQYLLVPHPRYIVPCPGIDTLVAATASCSGVTAYSALKKLPPCRDGDTLVLIGAGGLGLAALGMVRRLHPLARIAVVDANPDKLRLAAGQADAVFDIGAAASGSALRDFAAGGAAGVVDFVGVPQTFDWGLAALRKGGMLVVVGLFGGGTHVSIPLLPMRNLRIAGSYVGSLAEFHELLELLRDPALRTAPIQTRPVDEINAIFDDIAQGRVAGRVVALHTHPIPKPM
ncbi:MAG: alcohol dehydrogenase catalytic domain-containing protein [Rubrivivax sp.]|nr:alcohol dehydrogenase catalytic domain-containing protein [Rubrivivax sp.]